MSASVKVYHEGILLRRQWGRIYLNWFKERFCSISQPSLKYYDPKHIRGKRTLKGEFHVQRIRIVEKVPREVFGKDFCFQVGDQGEVMYFVASSDEEREKWMKKLRQFATDNNNKMLERYHSGVFAGSLYSSWSCCKNTERESVGCQTATPGSQPSSTSFESESSSNITGSTRSSTSTLTPSNTEPVPIQPSQLDPDMRQQTPHNQSFTGTIDSGIVCQWDSLMPPSNTKLGDYVVLQKVKHYSNKETNSATSTPTTAYYYMTGVYNIATCNLNNKHYVNGKSSLFKNNQTRCCYLLVIQNDGLAYAFIPSTQFTPISETTAGYSSNTILLLKREAEFPSQDSLQLESQSEITSDDNSNLQSYTPFHSLHTSGSVTALEFPDASTLISGSTESNVQIWKVPALTLKDTVWTACETSSLSMWGSFLAIGSNIVQIVDLSNEQERKIFMTDKVPLQNPPVQLMAFGPQGHLATVNSESNIVKVWPPPSQKQESITKPIWSSGCILDSPKNILCSLSVSTSEEQPWLIVGESAGCVHLLNWKEEEKTYHMLFPGNNRVGETSTAISHCGENVAAACGGCLVTWDISSRGIMFVVSNHPGDRTISSLCYSPDDAHLAAGMSTGEVVVYNPWSGNPIFTLEGAENGISTMLYSGCGSYFAIGYNNGTIQFWTTKSLPKTRDIDYTCKIAEEPTKPTFCSDLPLIGRVEGEIISREEEYIMEFLDYKIVVPANATCEGRKIPFQTGEMPLGPVGPFRFPPNTKPVSSVMWFHSNGISDLLKPIKIVLSHCLNCTSEDDLKRLVFVKAGDNNFNMNEMGEKEVQFHIVGEEEREGEPLFTKDDGTLTTRYNCWYAICEQLSKVSREEIDRARYCLTQAVPKLMTEGKYEICFILSYFLQSCMKVIETQYSGTHFVTHQTVTFSTQRHDPRIKVEFERNLEKGWTVACPSGRSVEVKDVYFLDILEKNREEFALALEYKQYPPNIAMDAHGNNATGDAVLNVKIIGADKELEQEIFLKKSGPEQTAEPVSAVDTVASLSELHSYGITTATQTPLQSSDHSENAVAGKPVHYYQPLQSTLPGPQPYAFPAQYFENNRHHSSSSPVQSAEVNPAIPVPES